MKSVGACARAQSVVLWDLDFVESCLQTEVAVAKRTTSSAELGRAYRRRRAELPPPDGAPCPRCRQPMWPTQRLHAGHVVDRALGGSDGPLQWEHGACNEAAGARLGNRLRARRLGPKWVDRWQ